jgi:hypothetical protein
VQFPAKWVLADAFMGDNRDFTYSTPEKKPWQQEEKCQQYEGQKFASTRENNYKKQPSTDGLLVYVWTLAQENL